jgi:uncharacterized protein (TIGR00255 family)
MILSMTGFGRSSVQLKSSKVNIEIKSVNSKQLDLNFRLNNLIRDKENDLRGLIAEFAERGKIDIAIFFENSSIVNDKIINEELLKSYYKQLAKLDRELKSNSTNLLDLALKMPNVFDNKSEELNDKDWKLILKAFKSALELFVKHRSDEGKSLEKDLMNRITGIEQLLKKVEGADKNRLPQIKNRLQKKLDDQIDKKQIDNNRFEQELIYFLERNDITEEKVRLKTHLDYFIKTCKEKAPGRKLGFISQEIGREINTIGSKANDAEIQKLVVQMKDELEKIKEQLNNVL